jgi:hypothetical protein
MARRHLAVFIAGVAEKILSGEKKVEIRLSQNRTLPYLEIAKDDEILLKSSGGKVIGKTFVENVLYYDRLTPKIIEALKQVHFEDAAMDQSFWKNKINAKFATVIFLKNSQKFITPIAFRKNDRRAWLIVE